MKSFIFTSDWHLRSLPSSSVRADSFTDVLLDRISQILSRDVDFIVHGGDFFDSYTCDDTSLLNKTIRLLRQYNKRIYIIPGNHDLVGYEIRSLDWTSLQTLIDSGLLQILPPGETLIDGIRFYAVYPTKDHSYELYKGLSNCFVVTHNLISPTKLPFKTTLVDEIVSVVDQCIFLCGDLHLPFIKVYDNCAFFNPGSLIDFRNEGSSKEPWFFELYFDPISFSCKYQKFSFSPIPFERVVEERVEDLFLRIDTSSFTLLPANLDEFIESIAKQLYPTEFEQIKEETFKWIRYTKEFRN